jgi:predicted RNase H-like HicB family nuclease
MKIKVIIYQAREGGYWAEVPGVRGCVSEGETVEEVKQNLLEALEGLLSVETTDTDSNEPRQVCELEV